MFRERSLSLLASIEAAMAALSPIERTVLALAASEGLSNTQIACRLGVSEQAAERHLARALRKLDQALES